MLDVLRAIHRNRGADVGIRPGSDLSIRAVAHLLDYDSATNLATVSVLDSEPIEGVPATPSTYTGITTVYVLLEGGRPVQVTGPASDLSGLEYPAASTSTTRSVSGLAVAPVGSGTYRTSTTSWGGWNPVTYGGASDVYQYGSTESGTLTGLAWYGDQIVDLDASEITRATLHLVSNGAGTSSSWTATVRGCADGTQPSGAPTYTGNTVTVTVPGAGKAGQIVTVELDATMRGDLLDGTIKSLGLSGLVYGGTYGVRFAPSWVLVLDLARVD